MSLGLPLAAIVLASFFGAAIMSASGIDPLQAYGAMLRGAFGDARAWSRTLEKASPLIFSGDMAKLDPFTLNVLCNHEVIEVNQDPLGKQARIIRLALWLQD